VKDAAGNTVDVKGPNFQTTVDFNLATMNRLSGEDPHAPPSDAQLLGHELAHDLHQLYGQPNTEADADKEINAILDTKKDNELKKDAGDFVDNLLKAKPVDLPPPPPPPPPPCVIDRQPCANL
jgi:hypothetical protein